MARELLLDTGALVSLLDRDQRQHAECRSFFHEWAGVVVTTEAVITEASHLLAGAAGGGLACLRFVLQGGAVVVPCSRRSMARALELMTKYADVPMDYADATLVALAEEARTDLVFTLDRRGFKTYRWGHRRSFRLLP